MMWYVKIPAVLPETEVRLVDLLLAPVIYAVILALLAQMVELTAIHFMIAFSIALGFLTPRIFGWNLRKPANRGVVVGHFFSGLWQFILFTDVIGKWGIFRSGSEGTITAEVQAMLFCVSVFALVGVSGIILDVRECIRLRKYGRALYSAMGLLPVFVEAVALLISE